MSAGWSGTTQEPECVEWDPLRHRGLRDAWVAQSVKHLTLVQVMISRLVSSSSASGSVLTAQSLELALDSVSPPLVTRSLSKINKD